MLAQRDPTKAHVRYLISLRWFYFAAGQQEPRLGMFIDTEKRLHKVFVRAREIIIEKQSKKQRQRDKKPPKKEERSQVLAKLMERNNSKQQQF
jgi:hypothetical protein